MDHSYIKRLIALAIVALLLGESRTALAIALQFVPSAQTVGLGRQADVDVLVADPGTTLVGSYDFSIDWDPAILAFAAIGFGTALGGPADSVALSTPQSGMIGVTEISLLLDLSAVQTGADFRLFTLTFDTVAGGTSTLGFRPGMSGFLGDDLGQPVPDVETVAGAITVTPQVVSTPETLPLLGAGVVGAAVARRRRPW